MKKMLVGAAVTLVATASAAQAADLMRGPYSPSLVSAAYSWIGPYIGANAGYQWGRTTNNGTRPSGVFGGVQAGYNWQYGQLVFGGELDIQLSNADDTFAGWKFANPWFSTLRGRAGVAMNNILFYGTLGFALGGGRGELGAVSESKTHTGWAAGLGAEVGLNQNWSVKGEYLYLDLAERGYTATLLSNGFHLNVLRFGLNYHF